MIVKTKFFKSNNYEKYIDEVKSTETLNITDVEKNTFNQVTLEDIDCQGFRRN